ncbi:MAG: 1-acyl-sn-glycerol-3-phosphate acyltransferase [Bacteroidetes bacterium]|nr:1-acyl-sn-glycerol-3-phosphate acyltransferase [Bacteroidota bacterium]
MQEETIEISEKFIDLEKIIGGKNPGIIKFIPRFIMNYLKRIIHVDEVNAAIYANRDKLGIDFATAILQDFGANIIVKGLENINQNGRYILVSNHPLGGLDGLALISKIGTFRKDILFPVNDILMNLPQLIPIFIPINKHGRNNENVQIIDEAFSSDAMMLFFPAGLVSRKQKGGIIKDLEWKKTFISKAKRYKRDIIPVYIDGVNSDFFYNLANFRKRIGLKANIEMLYLVDEMYKQKSKTINIILGKPISYLIFDKKYTDQQWAEKMKQYVYSLEHNSDIVFKNE